MKFSYTSWELDKIRRGLHGYRIHNAVNGHMLPFKTVLDALLLSPVTLHKYPADGSLPSFREEALRRFANGSSTLQPDKIEDLRRFLIHTGFLEESDFAEPPPGLEPILTACLALAGRHASIEKIVPGLFRCYVASKSTSDYVDTVWLEFYTEDSRRILRVRERHVRVVYDTSERGLFFLKDQMDAFEIYRNGYGCIGTSAAVLHLFLRGDSADDAVTYLEIEAVDPEGTKIYLSRSGGRTPIMGDDYGVALPEPLAPVPNLYAFNFYLDE